MKVCLVVAQGVHTGKKIPIATEQFLIGRDPHCNLRPASPAVSKQHCGLFIRGEKVFLQDYGSTNGSCVNGEQITGEREVANGDHLKIGPLEFTLSIDADAQPAPAKAAPQQTPVAAATSPIAISETVPAKTAAPAKIAPAKAAPAKVAPPRTKAATAAEEDEDAAAMMMMDEGDADPTKEQEIPDGTTIMEIPAIPGAKPDASKQAADKQNKADTSKAASDLLSKYMRRPRT